MILCVIWMGKTSSITSSTTTSSSSNSLKRLLEYHCQADTAAAADKNHYCSRAVHVNNRSSSSRDFVAKTRIRPNTKLWTIPREAQIWDIDALRSPLIQDMNLLPARHATSQMPLHNSAFLAAFLALTKNDPYVQYLPTYSDLGDFHPIVMDPDYLQQQLGGKHSYVYTLVTFLKDKIQSEYQALCTSSNHDDDAFANQVSADDYMASRIHVLSRSFQRSKTNIQLTPNEKVLFQHFDTTNSLAMVPVLDAADHRIPEHNIAWYPDSDTHDITVYTTKTLEPGAILYNAYGDTDSQEYMYAVYGFCLGTEPLSRSFTAYHQTIEGIHLPRTNGPPIASWQRPQLIQYLAHDDGYRDCITPSSSVAEYSFKALKLQILERIANAPQYWVVALPGRRKHTTDPPTIQLDRLEHLLQTCRLLALTHRDYNGMAPSKLQQVVQHKRQALKLEQGSNALEYRAWNWVHRLAYLEQSKYNVTLKEQRNIVVQQANGNEWTLAQVQLGELLTLETVMQYAKQAMEQITRNEDDAADFVIREEACPLANVEPLLRGHEY